MGHPEWPTSMAATEATYQKRVWARPGPTCLSDLELKEEHVDDTPEASLFRASLRGDVQGVKKALYGGAGVSAEA